MKNPPILIAILGFFAALAGFGYLFFGLRVLGFDWFGALGDLPVFEGVGLWGWLAIVTGIVWLLVAAGLWALQPWARIFALVMAAFALFEAGLAFIQFPGTGIGFAMALMPAVILWYLLTAEVKAAFGERAPATTAPEPVAPPAPVAAAAVAAARGGRPAAVAAPVAAAVAAEAAAPEPIEAPDAFHSTKLVDVEGIGAAYSETLASAGSGPRTTCSRPVPGRTTVSGSPRPRGSAATLILDWVDKVDLMRVPGVGPQYSDLLEAAGVGSPAELAQRNPAHLAVTVQEVVAARPGLVRRIPTEAELTAWVEAAGSWSTSSSTERSTRRP